MAPVLTWLEAAFAAVPLSWLEVWGQIAYIVGLGLAVLAFSGFTIRSDGRLFLGRERQAWDLRAFLSIPLTFILIVIAGYLGSFVVLVPGAQTFESLKDLSVFVAIVLFGYPALIAVPFAYGLSDLLEGVPPEFLLNWLPGYFINPACFWIAYQFIGRCPDFRRGRTWARYFLFVLLFMTIEPILWGFICAEQFTPEISYRSITPALAFTTAVTWLLAPVTMLIACPLARRLGLFWAAIDGHVWERPLGVSEWAWKSEADLGQLAVEPGVRGLPIRMYMLAPFVALVLGLVGATAFVTMRNAEAGADKLAGRLHESIAASVGLRLDGYLAEVQQGNRTPDTAAIQRLLTAHPLAQYGHVMIVTRSGEFVCGTTSADDPVAAAAVAGRLGDGALYRFAHVTTRPLARRNWLARAGTYRFDGLGIDWVLITAMPETVFLEGIQAGQSQTALVFVVALLMALVFAAWIASRVSVPLERLTEAAGALASGDLAARVPGTHMRELDELGRSFNEMAGRLQTSFTDLAASEQELRRHRDHLNDLVADRTAELSVVAARAETAYRQLRDLENLRDNLVQMVVHDMRSPLMVLMANLESMQHSTAALHSHVNADLRNAMSAVQSLTGMANDLLDVSRLEAGKMPINRKPCDLVALARRVRDAMASVDRGRMLLLAGDVSVPSECDSRIVQRVLENLIGNAIKHTPAGGTVRIVVSTRQGAHRVAVEDAGPGVPEEARHRIFEKFGRVDARTTTSYHSAGLGLTFCKLAVEAHGGRIGVDEGTVRGSVFWFELPA